MSEKFSVTFGIHIPGTGSVEYVTVLREKPTVEVLRLPRTQTGKSKVKVFYR
jgi:hypothetical protein